VLKGSRFLSCKNSASACGVGGVGVECGVICVKDLNAECVCVIKEVVFK
jgi:hypothetical protein